MENIRNDLGSFLQSRYCRMKFLELRGAKILYLNLKLHVRVEVVSKETLQPLQFVEIICTNAVDYVIRPRDPNCLEGGPLIELHEQHPWLERAGLQDVPGGDGEMFDPPLKFKLLILEQTHVIAEKFEIQPWKPTAWDAV